MGKWFVEYEGDRYVATTRPYTNKKAGPYKSEHIATAAALQMNLTCKRPSADAKRAAVEQVRNKGKRLPDRTPVRVRGPLGADTIFDFERWNNEH